MEEAKCIQKLPLLHRSEKTTPVQDSWYSSQTNMNLCPSTCNDVHILTLLLKLVLETQVIQIHKNIIGFSRKGGTEGLRWYTVQRENFPRKMQSF